MYIVAVNSSKDRVRHLVMGSGSKSRVQVSSVQFGLVWVNLGPFELVRVSSGQFRYQKVRVTPGFLGFQLPDYITIDGFGSDSGTKKVGFFPRVLGFRVPEPITSYAATESHLGQSATSILKEFLCIYLKG